jgi:hypothetical protein
MELFSTPPDATPEERLSLYRLRGLDYGILLIPFESLSRLQQEAALRLATEWGEELANVKPARRDIQHADNPWVPLAGLWLLRLSDGPIHRSDAEYWTDAVEEWHNEKGSDPRLGLLVRAAEHTQRHVGQLLVTVRVQRDGSPNAGA